MNTKPLFDYISNHINLTEQEGDLMVSKIKYRKYLKGQYLVQQGDVCRHESFVLKGCLKTFFLDQEGQEHIVMFGIENWWAADLGSFINQTPSDYNIQCLENTEVLQLSNDTLELLYSEIPKLERFFRVIIQQAYISAQKRIIHNFSLSAKDRYLKFKSQYPQIEQRVPQYMIASYLGITKEFLSKIRSQLIKDP